MNSFFKKKNFAKLLYVVAFITTSFLLPSTAFATGPGTNTVSASPSTTLVGSTSNTLTFTYTASGTMSGGSVSITTPATWSTPQGIAGVAGYTTVTTTGTVGQVLDNADSLSGWVRNTSSPKACAGGLSVDTSVKHSGTGSIKCINSNDNNTDNNGLWYSVISAQDWSSFATVGFWINSTSGINNGDLKFDYSTNSDLSSPVASLSLGSAVSANTWTYVSFNLTGTRTSIRSYGFHIANLSSMKGTTVYADDFAIGAGTTIVPTFSGRTMSVNAISLTNGQTITFTYGAGGGSSGAVAPSSPETSTFSTASTADNSTATSTIASSPTVSVVDQTVPTVALTAPTTGSTIHGNSVTLTATSSDNVAVAGVKFYYDSTHLIGSEITSTSSASTYSSTLNSTTLSDGSHTIIAVSRDSSNNQATTSAITITVDNTAPVSSSIASSTGATTGTVTWTTDENANSKVSYGTVSGTYTTSTSSASFVTSHSLTLTGLTTLTRYFFVVVSADASGNISTSTEKSLTTTNLDVTPPTLSSVSVSSNNASTTLAKVGDTITLAFTANESINTPVVTIAGHSVTPVNTSGNSYTASYTMISGDSEGSVPFSITATDVSGNTATAVTTTTNSTAVVFDKTAPTNQNTVFTPSVTKKGGSTVTVVSSGSTGNTIWFAPSGTTNFTARSTITTAGGTATSITAPATEGTYKLFIIDAAGNVSSESTATLTVDNTAPTLTSVTIASNNASTTLAKIGDTVTLTIVSSENIGTPTITIGAESGGNVTVSQGIDASHWTASAILTSSDSSGVVPFTVNFSDIATNAGTQVSTVTSGAGVVFDKTAPTAAITYSINHAVKSGTSLTITATFSEAVLSSPVPKISITGSNTLIATNMTRTDSTHYTYNFTVGSGDGTATVALSVGTDATGNVVTGTPTSGATFTVDNTAPTNEDSVFSSSATVQPNATVIITSSGDSTNTVWLAPSGTTNFIAGSTMTTASGNATSILAPSAQGTYVLYVVDIAGNISVASTATVTVDNNPPTLSSVSISSSNASTTLAKAGDTITLSFRASKSISAPTVAFTSGGVSVNGSVTVNDLSGNNWTATYVTDSSDSNGVIGFSVGSFHDNAGNNGTSVTSTTDGTSVIFDKTAPSLSSVMLSSSNASTTLAKVGDVVTLSFTSSENISTPTVAFTSGGVFVGNSVSVSNTSGNNWTATYTVGSGDTEGVVAYSVSGFHDSAGNIASTVTSGGGSVVIDKTSPTVTLTSSESNPTGNSPFSVTATFNESVTGFSVSDVSVGNGRADNLTGSGTTYTFDITPSGNGLVTASVLSGAAQDGAGNNSSASAQFSRTFSSSRPTVMLTSVTSPTKTSPFLVTATFSVDVSGFTSSDLVGNITNGTVSGFSGSGSVYTFSITPTSEGTVTVTIPSGVAVDSETGHNSNFASSPLSVVYDITPPTVAEVTSITSPTNDSTPNYTFSSSED